VRLGGLLRNQSVGDALNGSAIPVKRLEYLFRLSLLGTVMGHQGFNGNCASERIRANDAAEPYAGKILIVYTTYRESRHVTLRSIARAFIVIRVMARQTKESRPKAAFGSETGIKKQR
jgi:hypothetical protein